MPILTVKMMAAKLSNMRAAASPRAACQLQPGMYAAHILRACVQLMFSEQTAMIVELARKHGMEVAKLAVQRVCASQKLVDACWLQSEPGQ